MQKDPFGPTTDLLASLSASVAFFKLFGLGPLKLHAKSSRRLSKVSLTLGILIFAFYFALLAMQISEEKPKKSHKVNAIMNALQLSCFAASAIGNMVFSWVQVGKFAAMLDSLVALDGRIRQMGVRVSYGRNRVANILCIVAGTAALVYLGVYDYIVQIVMFHNQRPLHWFSVYLSAVLNVFTTCQLCTLNFLLYQCADGLLQAAKLSLKRQRLGKIHSVQTKSTIAEIEVFGQVEELGDVEQAYFVLEEGCRLHNGCFGVQNLVNFCAAFIVTTAQLYYIIIVEVDTLLFVAMLNWLGLYAAQTVVVVLGYHFVQAKANSIRYHLCKIALDSKASLGLKISHVVQKMSQNPVKFSACGIFEIQLPLLQGIVASVATYIIILVQFKNSTEEEEGTSGSVNMAPGFYG